MDTKYKLELDSSEICRGCLARNCQLTNLMCNEIVDGDILPMPSVYESVTGLPVRSDDGLPQKLCINCSTKIIDAYILRERCKKSAKLLRKILNLPEKEDAMSATAIECDKPTDACSLGDATAQSSFDEYDSNGPNESDLADYDIIEANDDAELDDGNIECVANYELDDGMVSDENVFVDDTEISMREEHAVADDANVPIDDIEELVDEADETDEIDDNKFVFFDRCSYCNKKFSDPNDFQSHVNEHMEILPLILTSANFFRCSRCRLVFASAKQLCTHIEAIDSCTIDSKNVLNNENCVDYQFMGEQITQNIDQIRMFSCQKSDEDGIIACEFCEYLFESFMDFIEHFNDVHLSNAENTEELYKDTANLSHCCGICAKTYMNIKDTMFHVYFHQTTFYCPFVGCSDKYEKSHYLNRHIAREHFTVEKHICDHCQWETNNYTYFKKHVRHECTARKFVCTTCGKRFLRKSTLLIHQRTHNESKLFKCTMCEKGFAQSTDLKNHIRIHTNERPFQCGICGSAFRTRSNRADHVATHVGENQFQCTICSKTFKSARILRGHLNLHAERNFSCEICGKRFGRRYHVKVHMKIHEKRNETIVGLN